MLLFGIDKTKKVFPSVTIIGRPNVGKSSLFNTIINKRKSIVDEVEGVTRDVISELVDFQGVKFILSDTAGYLESEEALNFIVRRKIEEAIHFTDLILFVVDGREIHPLDHQIARLLKRINKPVFVVANKLDNEKMRTTYTEVYSLGFENVFLVSAVHNYGVRTLLEEISNFLSKNSDIPANSVSEFQNEIRIVIVGKPNTGKSMLLNAILGYERSIVSEIPGTTRDAVDDIFSYNGRVIRLVDTAGIRRKAKIKDNIEYYSLTRTIKAVERSDVAIQLLDATSPISHQDKTITEMVVSKGVGIVIAYNKWDLVSVKKEENYFLMDRYRKLFLNEYPAYSFIPVEFVSAKEKYKIPRLLNTAIKVYEDRKFRIPTSTLNEWLQKNVKESNVNYPVSKLKVYYATQVETSPPHFVFFVNNKEYLRQDYERFIENKIRTAFEFTGTPIKISFRESGNNTEEFALSTPGSDRIDRS